LQFLEVVSSPARAAAGLADGNHVQHLVEVAVAGERDPMPDHLSAGGLDGGDPCSEEAKWALLGNRATSPTIPTNFAARMGPIPKISL
jgi:hypothetical protein